MEGGSAGLAYLQRIQCLDGHYYVPFLLLPSLLCKTLLLPTFLSKKFRYLPKVRGHARLNSNPSTRFGSLSMD